jgi:hypothetical protein
VTANSRSGLFALAGSTAAAGVAAGIESVAGAAWVLRIGTIVYLAAMLLALRLPDQIDVPVVVTAQPVSAQPVPAQPIPVPPAAVPPIPGFPSQPPGTLPLEQPALPPGKPGTPHGANRGRWRTLANVGPVVSEAMAVNAVLRAFSGYILFMLAFLLRSLPFGAHYHHVLVHGRMELVQYGGVSNNFKLGALALGLSAGSLMAMGAGSMLKARAPQLMMFGVLAVAPLVAAASAWFFGLWAAVAVEFAAIFCASLAKLAQDSIVQREIGEEIRSSTFSVSETLNQVANVAGGLAGVLVSVLNNGQAGLGIAAAFLAVAFILLVSRRRRRVLTAKQFHTAPHAA